MLKSLGIYKKKLELFTKSQSKQVHNQSLNINTSPVQVRKEDETFIMNLIKKMMEKKEEKILEKFSKYM